MASRSPLSLLRIYLRFAAVLLVMVLFPAAGYAAFPAALQGQWFQINADQACHGALIPSGGQPVAGKIAPTGGCFVMQADIALDQGGRYVIDFKNSSVIGYFRHEIYNDSGQLLARLEGGIQNNAENPFFLRHGREIDLTPGRYRVLTLLDSPFFLAQPQPYIDTSSHYQQSIMPGNALVLMCMGVFMGLGVYYAALAVVRRRLAEGMYTLFILGNLLYNGTALLVYPQLFGMHWFYLISLPILFSNCAYIFFVMGLLEINKQSHARLYRVGVAILSVLSLFILMAWFKPNWSLELDRYGVGLFLTYGLTAGIVRARQGHPSARIYLIAIAAFFTLGTAAISQARFDAMYTLYIEHLGLGAVAVEVVLLALVLSYQFAQLHRDKEFALARVEHSTRIAYTDALTGLPNRYVLELELERLPSHGSLTFIDLDGLKHYNDQYGHERGDDLLRSFSSHLAERLNRRANLHRLGGDEFAITCHDGDLTWVENMIAEAVSRMQLAGYEFAGASSGSVHVHECPSRKELKHTADTRMYENKRRRQNRDR